MAKKRKNAKTPEGDAAAVGSSMTIPKASTFDGQKSRRHRPFDSFPLHLLSNDLQRVSPATSSSSKMFQELVPGRVLVVPEFFSAQECQEWVSFCESSGGLEYTAHPATKFVAHRECFRMQQADATMLAKTIFDRMKSIPLVLPTIQREMDALYCKHQKRSDDYSPVGCNPNLRVYKYERGHSFGKHVDGSESLLLVDTDGSFSGGGRRGKTEWTVLIYLSECQGGATRFYTANSSSTFLPRKRTTSKQHPFPAALSTAFEPQVGAMLLHLHGEFCLEHEADPVLGGTKFVLRTDLVFSSPD